MVGILDVLQFCHLSSEVEQRFCKAKVLGSNPRGGFAKLKHRDRQRSILTKCGMGGSNGVNGYFIIV